MSYRRDLKRLRRAWRRLQHQRDVLLTLELEGIISLTLHSVAQSLTLSLTPETQSEPVDLLLAALRQRRRALQVEVIQVRQDWQQDRETQPLSAPN